MAKKEKKSDNEYLDDIAESLEKSNDMQKKSDKKSEKEKKKGDPYIKKMIKDQVSDFKEILSPGKLLKNVGLFSGSPLLAIVGDKLESITETLLKQRKEAKEQFEKENKNQFLQEKIKDDELEQRKRTNDLLEEQLEISEKSSKQKDSKGMTKKLIDFIKSPLESIKMALVGGAGSLFSLGKAGAAGLGKFAKGILGKVALPLSAILGLVDFSKGFQNALEITEGDTSFKAKFLAGISKAISGFTFGLINPKTIYKGANLIFEKVKNILLDPFKLLKDFAKGEISLTDLISQNLENITFGFISKDQIKSLLDFTFDKIKKVVLTPFKIIGDLIKGKSIVDIVKDTLSEFSLDLFTIDDIKKTFSIVTNYVSDVFVAGRDRLINFYKNFVLSDFVDSIFGEGVSDIISDKIDTIKNSVNEKYENLKNLILTPINFVSNTLTNLEDKVLGFSTAIVQKKDEFLNLLASPFNTLSNMFDGTVIENIVDKISTVKEKGKLFIDGIKEKFNSIIDLIKNPVSLISSLFDKINIFKDKETDLLKKRQLDLKQENLLAENIQKTPKEKKNIIQEQMRLEKLRRDIEDNKRKAETQAQTNIQQNNNSAVVLPEDMRTNSDDATFNLFAPEGVF